MKKFDLTINGKAVEYYLPTCVEDIKAEYLKNVTDHISIGDEHSLVAIVYKIELAYTLNARRHDKNTTTNVIPMFVKCGQTDNEFIKILDPADIIIVSGSDISLGHHVGNPANKISLNNVVNLFSNNKEISKNSLLDKNSYYLVEFKIIPNCAIHGKIGTPTNVDTTEYFKFKEEV